MQLTIVSLLEKCELCGESKIAETVRMVKWCPACQMKGINIVAEWDGGNIEPSPEPTVPEAADAAPDEI